MKALKEFNGHKGVFSFRIDLDFFHPKHVMETTRVAEKHDICMTWFVNMLTGQYHKADIRRIAETQDVQNHGFLHETIGEEQGILENIHRADLLLKDAGIKCTGFAAPFGYWNKKQGKALERTGYVYSSEFRQGKNIFPFYPRASGKKATVLQVPIHPVCLGNLFEAGYSEKEAIEYFDRIIDLLYEKQAPIFLYGHPTGRLGAYPKVLDRIFSKAKQLDDVWFTTLTDYARFWKRKDISPRKRATYNHNAFLENRLTATRRIAQLYKGQLLRIDKKKIDRRLHK